MENNSKCRRPDPIEKFWAQVKKTKKCWLWTGNCKRYGQMGVKNKIVRVHRFSYELHKGKIPKGMCICHSCDNVKCVNPKHLWLGTHLDNVKDCFNKKRTASGEKNGMSKLTLDQVEDIRKLYEKGNTQKLLSLKFGVAISSINRIIHKKRWKKE